jgi:transposase-like protein
MHFNDYPTEIRRVIHTTNAIGRVHMSLRKLTKIRGSFPNDEVLIKVEPPRVSWRPDGVSQTGRICSVS